MTIMDVKLTQNLTDNIWDLSLNSEGDLLIDESFDTPIIVSLFTDTRADESEVAPPNLRRGFWAYDEIGSKIWLLQRRTIDNLNRSKDFARQSLQWLIDDGYLKNIDVQTAFIEDGISITIKLVRFDNRIETLYYEAWEQSEFN